MGQVSLPVLSRKGKYDNWNYNWTAFKNYTLMHNEDFFIKKFIFIFFMYGITNNKYFLPVFLKKQKNRHNYIKINKYNLTDSTMNSISMLLNKNNRNKYYISKIYLCRYKSWLFIYTFVYSVTNLRVKTLKNKIKIQYNNYSLLQQTYLFNKYMYLINNISKKTLSINQSHLSIEYVNMSMHGFSKSLYGFGKTQVDFFTKKFEKHNHFVYDNFKKKYKFFNKKIYNSFPTPIALHKKHTLNVYVLDMIQSHKGIRHARGLPCRGQRTWTNAWTSYRANTTLRVFKVKLLNRAYKKVPHGQLNMYYLAEQINLLWKVFWKDEWLNAKKKVIVVSKKKNFNVDVASMAKGNIISPTRLKKMSKKQKSSIGKNTLTLGFDIGFTKKVLMDLYKRDKLKILKNVKNNKVKKKKIDIKTKIIKHKLKKKSKKSLWD